MSIHDDCNTGPKLEVLKCNGKTFVIGEYPVWWLNEDVMAKFGHTLTVMTSYNLKNQKCRLPTLVVGNR